MRKSILSIIMCITIAASNVGVLYAKEDGSTATQSPYDGERTYKTVAIATASDAAELADAGDEYRWNKAVDDAVSRLAPD